MNNPLIFSLLAGTFLLSSAWAEEPRTLPEVSVSPSGNEDGALSGDFVETMKQSGVGQAQGIVDFLTDEGDAYKDIIATMPKYDLQLEKVTVGKAAVADKGKMDKNYRKALAERSQTAPVAPEARQASMTPEARQANVTPEARQANITPEARPSEAAAPQTQPSPATAAPSVASPTFTPAPPMSLATTEEDRLFDLPALEDAVLKGDAGNAGVTTVYDSAAPQEPRNDATPPDAAPVAAATAPDASSQAAFSPTPQRKPASAARQAAKPAPGHQLASVTPAAKPAPDNRPGRKPAAAQTLESQVLSDAAPPPALPPRRAAPSEASANTSPPEELMEEALPSDAGGTEDIFSGIPEAPPASAPDAPREPRPKIIKIRTGGDERPRAAKKEAPFDVAGLPASLEHEEDEPESVIRPWTKEAPDPRPSATAPMVDIAPDSLLLPPGIGGEKRVRVDKGGRQVASRAVVTGDLSAAQQPYIGLSQFTSGVEHRAPVDRLSAATSDMGILTYFSALKYMKNRTLFHRWELNGRKLFDKPFDIGGDQWRVWSSVRLKPGITGTITVKTLDSQGRILAEDHIPLQ